MAEMRVFEMATGQPAFPKEYSLMAAAWLDAAQSL
jgi:hypothetical protein